jgi:hypothetical protein
LKHGVLAVAVVLVVEEVRQALCGAVVAVAVAGRIRNDCLEPLK